MRTVDGLVAAGGPAGAALDEGRVVPSADEQLAGAGLLLEVALKAERLVAGLEHFRVHRAMRIVTGGAVVAQRLVLEDERPALGLVAFEAGLVRGGQLGAAAEDRVTLVRIVTLAARYLVRRMRVWQRKLAAFVQMALEAGFRIARGIDDIVHPAAYVGVNAAGAMAGFATHVLRIVPAGHQLCVGRVLEPAGDILVALRAFLGADEFRAGNLRRHEHRSIHHHAGDEQQSPNGSAAEDDGVFSPTRAEGHDE